MAAHTFFANGAWYHDFRPDRMHKDWRLTHATQHRGEAARGEVIAEYEGRPIHVGDLLVTQHAGETIAAWRVVGIRPNRTGGKALSVEFNHMLDDEEILELNARSERERTLPKLRTPLGDTAAITL